MVNSVSAARKKMAKKNSRGSPLRNRASSPGGGTHGSAFQLADAGGKGSVRRDDWRVETLARVRAIIKQAVPGVDEEVKWRKPSNSMAGVPVWSLVGIICTGETYKDKVKLTFARGASLPDPSGLFNSSLEGNTRRAIDLHEGDKLNEKALKALVRAAAAMNMEATGSGRKAGGRTGIRGTR